MRTLPFLLLLFTLPFLGFGQGISFEHGTFAELKAKAASTGKPIFIDAYTTWCGPCKWMSKTVFPEAKVGEHFNSRFVSAKIDMEKGEGIQLAEQFQVTAYPTLLFLDKDGNLIHRAVGARNADELIDLARLAVDPDKNLAGMARRFQANPADDKLAYAYFFQLEDAGSPDLKASFDRYLSTQKPEEYIERRNWNMLLHFVNNPENVLFQHVLKEKAAYQARYTADSVALKIRHVLVGDMARAADGGNKELWEKRRDQVRTEGVKDGERFIARTFIELAGDDLAERNRRRVVYLDKYPSTNPDELNEMAWGVYESSEDPATLAKAEGWAKTAAGLQPENPMIRDTYAALLFKTKKYAQAKEEAQKAIDLGAKSGEKMEETRELLKKIEAAMTPSKAAKSGPAPKAAKKK